MNKQKHTKQEKIIGLREILNVPPTIRIAQHIYNQCRDYEQSLRVVTIENDEKLTEKTAQGIDIFYIEDEEFIKKFK